MSSAEHDRPSYAHINPRARRRAAAPPPALPTAQSAFKPPLATAKSQARTRWRTSPVEQADQTTLKSKGGYKNPPVDHQFKKGGPPGPGRPKGSKSQDTILRAELEAKHPIRIGGRERHVPKRTLIAKLFVNGALEKRTHKQLADVNTEARRLFPEQDVEAATRAAHDPTKDREFLQAFLKHLTMGEPGPDGGNPLADMASGGLDLGQGGDQDAWSEGDWNAADGEASDEDR